MRDKEIVLALKTIERFPRAERGRQNTVDIQIKKKQLAHQFADRTGKILIIKAVHQKGFVLILHEICRQ